ncbi:MAG TPA: FecR family protein [Mucilaginibacter sp.]|jgi:ferric-dicitrate binding protein FerR (iron transport regulator)|nr:FecR family protein [Mucilaginibacter sp.]
MLHLTKKKLQELSDKWLSGTITKEEQSVLDEWYNQESHEIINWESDDDDETNLRERLFAGILKETQAGEPPQIKFFKNAQARKVAAMIVVLLSCCLYFLIPHVKPRLVAKNNKPKKVEKATPNKAILTLADGSTVILDNAGNGLVAREGNTRVNKTSDGELIYSASKSAGQVTAVPQFNSISTPAGGQYQVSLADGSKVWLNAMSTLKFPAVFSGTKRVVELTGEAYFEVAKNKNMPFKVSLANSTSIEVLGTHFNIMAYADEKNIDATLLEGSISVKKGDMNKMITPGQQAKITDDIKVSNVDAEESIAWKKGLFSFDRSDTQTIMRQIGRWYGVEVVYQGKIPSNQLTGYISRSAELPEVLKMLQISGLKTTINDKKITVLN